MFIFVIGEEFMVIDMWKCSEYVMDKGMVYGIEYSNYKYDMSNLKGDGE